MDSSSQKPPSDHSLDPIFSQLFCNLSPQGKLPSSLNCLIMPATHPLSLPHEPPVLRDPHLPSPGPSRERTVHTLLQPDQAWFLRLLPRGPRWQFLSFTNLPAPSVGCLALCFTENIDTIGQKSPISLLPNLHPAHASPMFRPLIPHPLPTPFSAPPRGQGSRKIHLLLQMVQALPNPPTYTSLWPPCGHMPWTLLAPLP